MGRLSELAPDELAALFPTRKPDEVCHRICDKPYIQNPAACHNDCSEERETCYGQADTAAAACLGRCTDDYCNVW